MKQPTRAEITQRIDMVLNDSLLREELCEWAVNYIRNDDQVDIEDPGAWHYLMEISNIDEMVEPGVFLFDKEDILCMKIFRFL